ncbi:MAG: TIGR04255 family protein [Chloroflexota bacterium]|nr:TIGR04255 family protein [Chloroflexota bacterium]
MPVLLSQEPLFEKPYPYTTIEMVSIPGPIPQDFHSFLFQIEIPYTAPVSVLKVLFGALKPSTEANSSYVLDIAMFSPLEHVPDVDHVANWLDIAHERIENVFNASFTEKTHREVFKEKR